MLQVHEKYISSLTNVSASNQRLDRYAYHWIEFPAHRLPRFHFLILTTKSTLQINVTEVFRLYQSINYTEVFRLYQSINYTKMFRLYQSINYTLALSENQTTLTIRV